MLVHPDRHPAEHLDILARNFALKNKGVKLYELGKIYLPVEGQTLPMSRSA